MSGDATAALGEASASHPRAPQLVAPLVGRDDALSQLAETVAAPSVTVIAGGAGIGKTRLLQELRRRPEVKGRRFLVGSCPPIREPEPLGPIVAALRQLAGGLDGIDLPPTVAALHPFLPGLRDRLPTPSGPSAGPAAERRRRFRGLTDLLAALGPTILAIEDTHWLDDYSRDFLATLLADPPGELSVVLTARVAAAPGVPELLAALPKSVDRLHLALGPLDAAQTASLVAALIDTDDVSTEFATYLCERSEGSPLAIQEQIALLRARDALDPDEPGGYRGPLAELRLPPTLRELTLARLEQLSSHGRAVVDAAATLRLPTTLATVVGTAATSEHDALRGVDEAIECGLLVERGETLALRHAVLSETIYENLPAPKRRELHARAAASLEQLWPVPWGQVTHHRRTAGEPAAWVRAAQEAADRATAIGDLDEAIRLLKEPLGTADLDATQRIGLALRLGRVALEAPRPDELIAPLAEALEKAAELPPAVRGKLRFWLGLLLQRSGGDQSRQRDVFAQAVEELDDQPALKASAMVCLALGSQPNVADNLAWVRRARDVLQYVDDPPYEVFLQSKIGAVMVMAGDPEWREATDRIVERTRGRPRRGHEVRAYGTIVEHATWAGHHETAGDWLSRIREAAPVRDDDLSLRLRINTLVLDFCRGRWTGLRDRVERCAEQLADRPRLRVDLDLVAGRLALAHGDLTTAERHVDEAERRLGQLEAADLLAVAADARIRLALAQGDSTTAAATADRLMETVRTSGVWLPITRAVPSVVEALATTDATERAATWLTKLGQELRELDAPLAPAALEHAHGVLASGEGRWDAAVGHFRTAATRYEALGCPYESALAHEQAAHAQLVAKPPEALDPLNDAAAVYRNLGARADLDRVTETARLHGMTLRPGRPRTDGDDLTPREREVAELAGAGHTNREIADKLAVSVSTVKKHLSATMRKLGIETRDDLPRRVRELRAEAPPAT